MLSLGLSGLYAQKESQKLKIYKATVFPMNVASSRVKGALYENKDSSIVISNSYVKKDFATNNFQTTEIHVRDIKNIRIRRKNKTGKNLLIGTLIGVTLGGIVGYAQGDDSCTSGWCFWSLTAEDKAVLNGMGFGVLGAGIGALSASFSLKIDINGNPMKLDRLRKYSIKKFH